MGMENQFCITLFMVACKMSHISMSGINIIGHCMQELNLYQEYDVHSRRRVVLQERLSADPLSVYEILNADPTDRSCV